MRSSCASTTSATREAAGSSFRREGISLSKALDTKAHLRRFGTRKQAVFSKSHLTSADAAGILLRLERRNDKGTPVGRPGRKARGPTPRSARKGSPAAEVVAPTWNVVAGADGTKRPASGDDGRVGASRDSPSLAPLRRAAKGHGAADPLPRRDARPTADESKRAQAHGREHDTEPSRCDALGRRRRRRVRADPRRTRPPLQPRGWRRRRADGLEALGSCAPRPCRRGDGHRGHGTGTPWPRGWRRSVAPRFVGTNAAGRERRSLGGRRGDAIAHRLLPRPRRLARRHRDGDEDGDSRLHAIDPTTPLGVVGVGILGRSSGPRPGLLLFPRVRCSAGSNLR